MADKQAIHLSAGGAGFLYADIYAFERAPGKVHIRITTDGMDVGVSIPHDFARQIATALAQQADAAEANAVVAA